MLIKNINVKINPQFTEANERTNIQSDENLLIIFGKIKKFFSDLKPVAFSSSYADLVDKNMSGYSKAQTVTAISSEDTINEAIGKLEKGLDNINETITDIEPITSEELAAMWID